MLREVKNGGWARTGGLVARYRFAEGPRHSATALSRGRLRRLQAEQAQVPVAVLRDDARRRVYWAYRDRFWWEDDGLDALDVAALVAERERAARRRLQRAHDALAHTGGDDGPPRRPGIPLELRREVWERDGGRCAACGARFELQFDHVIPVAMGGATSAANLQVLCGPCNRAKGASLG